MFSVPSLSPIFFKLELQNIFTVDMAIILFTFLFVDMFDTVGTLIGVTTKAGLIDKDGKIRLKKKTIDLSKLTDEQLRHMGIDPKLSKKEIAKKLKVQ